MAWFKRETGELDTSGEKKVRTEGLWVKCEGCRQIIWKKDLEENMNVCPKCDKHFRIDARARLALLLDDNQYETFDGNISSTDPLKFVDLKPYSSRLKQAQKDRGLKEAIIIPTGNRMGERGDGRGRSHFPCRRALCRFARAPDYCVGIRRCSHDGRCDQLDATGEG